MANRSTNTDKKVRYLVQLSVLVAILLFLEFTGVGMIKTPFLEFTVMQVPVIIGAIVMGPMAGGILGGVFGLLSFWECFGKSAFGAALLSIDPLGTFMTCVPTRILMGIFCALVFRGLLRADRTKNQFLAFGGAGLAGSLINTALFMGSLVLFFYHTPFMQNIAQGLAESFGIAMNPVVFIALFVGIQGLLEALICTLVGAAVSRALYSAIHK